VTAAATARTASRSPGRSANTELGLLVLAILIVCLAYALVGLSQDPVLPSGLLGYGGSLAAMAAVAHVVRRRLAPGADPLLLPLAFLLNGIGLVMVRRIDFANLARNPEAASLAPQQTIWTFLGVAAFCATIILLRDHQVLDRYRYVIGIGGIVALLLPLLPVIGVEINGARIWLRIAGFSIQPGEFAKIGLAVFFASYLAENRQLLSVATSRLGPFMVPPARAFGPVLLVWLASLAVLVFQSDLGLSLLLFGMFVVLLYIATARLSYLLGGGLLFASGAAVAYQLFGHVRVRVAIWLDPFADPQGAGFQLVQSLFALGTGGILGVGWGNGRPDFIPFVQTDFIFAAFGEELGLVGTTAILLCYFLVVGRGFAIAARAETDFGQLLAACLTVIFGLQVFVIVGGVTRLIPLSGLTLPFASYGGSSLLANYILIALLLRISAGRTAGAAGEGGERSLLGGRGGAAA
jgi:cell division protein FtsW (lipid II flippase)